MRSHPPRELHSKTRVGVGAEGTSRHDGDAEEDESFEGHQELLQPQRRGRGRAQPRCREGQGDSIGNRDAQQAGLRGDRARRRARARAVLLRARGGRESARGSGHRRERRGGRREPRGEPPRFRSHRALRARARRELAGSVGGVHHARARAEGGARGPGPRGHAPGDRRRRGTSRDPTATRGHERPPRGDRRWGAKNRRLDDSTSRRTRSRRNDFCSSPLSSASLDRRSHRRAPP